MVIEFKGEKIPENAHTIVSFTLPYAIPVDDGVYKVRVGKDIAEIWLRRVQVVKFKGGEEFHGKGFAQLRYDKYGRSSFSFIEIKIPNKLDIWEKGRKPLILEDVPQRWKSKEIVLRFLNRFIETVRYVTGVHWVEPARYQDIFSLKMSYWDGNRHYPAGALVYDNGVGGIVLGKGNPFHLETEKSVELRRILEDGSSLDSSRVFLLNSKDACVQEDFRLAIIESVVALETVLYKFIRMQGEKLTISPEELDHFITEVGLTGNISVVLKMLTKDIEQIDEDTIRKCKGAIKIRNKILHEGLTEAFSTDIEERVMAIEKMVSYLKRLLS